MSKLKQLLENTTKFIGSTFKKPEAGEKLFRRNVIGNPVFPFHELNHFPNVFVHTVHYKRFYVFVVASIILILITIILFLTINITDTYIIFFTLTMLLMIYEIWWTYFPKTYVLDTNKRVYEFYNGNTLKHRGTYHNIYIRLIVHKGSDNNFYYKAVLGGHNIAQESISHYSKERKDMMQMAQRLAQHLGINYFDYEDISKRHVILHWSRRTKPTVFSKRSEIIDLEDVIIKRKQPLSYRMDHLNQLPILIEGKSNEDITKRGRFESKDSQIFSKKVQLLLEKDHEKENRKKSVSFQDNDPDTEGREVKVKNSRKYAYLLKEMQLRKWGGLEGWKRTLASSYRISTKQNGKNVLTVWVSKVPAEFKVNLSSLDDFFNQYGNTAVSTNLAEKTVEVTASFSKSELIRLFMVYLSQVARIDKSRRGSTYRRKSLSERKSTAEVASAWLEKSRRGSTDRRKSITDKQSISDVESIPEVVSARSGRRHSIF